MSEPLIGFDMMVGKWVVDHLRGESDIARFWPFTAIGVVRDEQLVAGVIYSNFHGHDIQMTIASIDPNWCNRAVLRCLFNYPFVQLECQRVTALIAKRNKRARALVERLGFRMEGVHRRAMDGRQDSVSYGLLNEECKWIA